MDRHTARNDGNSMKFVCYKGDVKFDYIYNVLE